MLMSLIPPIGAADSESPAKKPKAAGKKKQASKVEDDEEVDIAADGSEENDKAKIKSDPDETEEDYEDQ
jgi:hypothetical protein